MDADRSLRRLAQSQHGVVTRSDARATGLSDRQLLTRVRRGDWVPFGRRVLVLAGSPPTPHQRLLVATLRADALASHRSAAWLHGLVDDPPSTPEVVRPSGRGDHLTEVSVHHSGDLLPRDRQRIDGIATTTATRTLIDLASATRGQDLRRVLDRALREGRTHPDALITRFLALPRRGRPGTSRLRALLEHLDEDAARLESDLESKLFAVLQAAGLPAPEPQVEVVVDDCTYRLDLAYPAHKLAIEGDGFAFHSDRESFELDRERQNALVLAGWTVLRFTWRQVCGRPEWVVEQIRTALRVALD